MCLSAKVMVILELECGCWLTHLSGLIFSGEHGGSPARCAAFGLSGHLEHSDAGKSTDPGGQSYMLEMAVNEKEPFLMKIHLRKNLSN